MRDGPVMLITGTRKGIGLALARHYLAQGYRVAGCSRGPASVEADGYTHYRLDVSDEGAVQRMLADIREHLGGLRVLINNASIAAMNHALLTPLEIVRNVLETNVVGTFLLCREAAKSLRSAAHARIVNFSTIAVPLRLAGEAIYAASKAAVESLTRVLAGELSPLGITCNAVGPGPILTDLIRSVPQKKIDRLLQMQAISRLAQPLGGGIAE